MRTVFILCPGHSGSTLIDLVLGSHSKCHSLGEFIHVEAFLSRGEICHVCTGVCKFWETFRTCHTGTDTTVHKAAHRATRGKILIDSSKTVSWFYKTIKDNPDMDFQIIRLVRSCYGAMLSHKFKKQFLNTNAIERWVRATKRFDICCKRFEDKVLTVRYEDFCTHPARVAKRMCGFIGLKYQPQMLQFWKHKHHPCGGNGKPVRMVRRYQNLPWQNDQGHVVDFLLETGFRIRLDERWRSMMTEDEKRMIANLAGPLHQQHGYQIPEDEKYRDS
jgi:hypothetical protein